MMKNRAVLDLKSLGGVAMKQADLDRVARLRDLHSKLKDIAYKNVCVMCSSSLYVSWNGQLDTFELACGLYRTHQGYERLQSLYETWRRGGTLPVEVAQALEHKYGKGRKEK